MIKKRTKIKSILHNCKYGKDGLEEAEEIFSRIISGLEEENADLKVFLHNCRQENAKLVEILEDYRNFFQGGK